MNIATILLNLLSFIPAIVAKVQAEHSEKNPEAKTQIVSDWIGLGAQVAGAVSPANATVAQQAASLAQGVIAASVQALHSASGTPAQ